MVTKYITIIVLGLFAFFAGSSHAVVGDFVARSYLFHLYFDDGQIYADRDFEFNYDVTPENFIPENITTSFPYSFRVVNLKNEVVADHKFDPRGGDESFTEGAIKIKVPYFADAKDVNFYSNRGDIILTFSVADSSFCNDDRICDEDVGENADNCPNDCGGSVRPRAFDDGDGSGTLPPSGGGYMGMVLLSLIVAGVAGGGWYGWKWWQKRQNKDEDVQFAEDLNSNDNLNKDNQ